MAGLPDAISDAISEAEQLPPSQGWQQAAQLAAALSAGQSETAALRRRIAARWFHAELALAEARGGTFSYGDLGQLMGEVSKQRAARLINEGDAQLNGSDPS